MAPTTYGEQADQPTMKAWRVHEFGSPDRMIFETVPRPRPAAGEVLVKVHAAGVGPYLVGVVEGGPGQAEGLGQALDPLFR